MYTQPLAGHYNNLTLFIVNGVIRLLDTFDGNANFSLVNLVGGCDDEWSVQETLVEGKCKNGIASFSTVLKDMKELTCMTSRSYRRRDRRLGDSMEYGGQDRPSEILRGFLHHHHGNPRQ